jgi:hypothetical protein
MAGPHASNDVRCTDCHEIQARKKAEARAARLNFDTASAGRAQAVEDLVPESKALMEPRWERNEVCLTCHQAQRGEMSLPYHHPLREGKMDLGPARLRWEHSYSIFNDRLSFPVGTFTGDFNPLSEGVSSNNCPPVPGLPRVCPAPAYVPIGPGGTPAQYNIEIPAPNQYSADSLVLTWMATPKIDFNGQVSYTRLQETFTQYRQNAFDSDDTLNWRPIARLRVTADYHQQNLLNAFTPYYSMYGNVSYHDHWEGLRLDYELPRGFDVEGYYQRGGITRSNAFLWQQTAMNILGPGDVPPGIPSQIYSIDNSDLLKVVPSSFSNTTGLALRTCLPCRSTKSSMRTGPNPLTSSDSV